MSNLNALARWNTHLGWTRAVVRTGVALARSGPVQAVAVSSPPHASHLAGVRLTKKLGVPFLADFRDPWLFGDSDVVQSALVDRMLGMIAQRRTFGSVSKVILNTTWSARAVRATDRRIVDRTVTVPNGYDPRPGIGRPDTELFRVAFVGWLYDFMDPAPVLAACGRLRKREGLEAMRVEFVGTSPAPAGISLRALARAHGLEAHFEHRERVPRAVALDVQQRAAVQVVFDYPSPLRIPMKFYDGVQMYGDLLLIGRRPSALEEAAGKVALAVCAPDDAAAIDAAMDRALARWRTRDYSKPIDAQGLFSRAATSRRMLEELEGLMVLPAGGRIDR